MGRGSYLVLSTDREAAVAFIEADTTLLDGDRPASGRCSEVGKLGKYTVFVGWAGCTDRFNCDRCGNSVCIGCRQQPTINLDTEPPRVLCGDCLHVSDILKAVVGENKQEYVSLL